MQYNVECESWKERCLAGWNALPFGHPRRAPSNALQSDLSGKRFGQFQNRFLMAEV